MPKAKITEAHIQAAKPKSAPYDLLDTALEGFLVRVQPTGNKAYYVKYKLPDGRRTRTKIGACSSIALKDARAAAKIELAKVAKGQEINEVRRKQAAARKREKNAHTLETFIEKVYEPWAESNLKSHTSTIQRLKKLFPTLYKKKLSSITGWGIEHWRAKRLKAGVSRATVNRDIGALKSMLARAVEWGELSEHPLKSVKPLKVDKHARTRYLDDDEEKRLREALAARDAKLKKGRANANVWRKQRGYALYPEFSVYSDHMTPMVLLSLNTGVRRGELFQLRWSDVDLERRVLTVRGVTAKSEKTRHIPLNDEALHVLKSWKGRDTNPLVFPGKNGERFDNVNKAWSAILDAAKVKGFRWHDLRHTFASKLVMAGVDLNTVRELLGHSDLKMTLRYAHLSPKHKAEAVSVLCKPSDKTQATAKQSACVAVVGGRDA